MKKSKIVLAVALAVVLVITCVSFPTFSWFTRNSQNQSLSGYKMVLQHKNSYTAYNGNGLSLSTFASDDGITYSTTATTDYSVTDTTTPLGSHKRKYFCSTITNSSGSVQNVSLYANILSIPAGTNGTLAIGVNGPTRSYRDYTALTNKNYNTALNYSKRIYFETYNVDGWGGKDIYVTFGYEYGTDTYKMTWFDNDDTYGAKFYADVPYSVDEVWFSAAGWQTANNGGSDYTMRSATFSGLDKTINSITQSKLFRIKNETDNNQNRKFDAVENVNGANIKQYCSNVTLAQGASFNTVNQGGETLLIRHPNSTVQYSSSNVNVFTVDEHGVITAVGSGLAKLTTSVKGGTFNDYFSKETTVVVMDTNCYEFYDVPIVKNLEIPVDDPNTKDKYENQVNVYWYVINNSDTTGLNYQIDGLSLGM